MQKYRYYLPPQSKLPFAAGILSGLLCLDNIYTLISMPHYTSTGTTGQHWLRHCCCVCSASCSGSVAQN